MLLCAAGAAFADPLVAPTLDQEKTKKLEAGEVIVTMVKPTDNAGLAARSLGIVHAPTSEVWPVVRDCEHFADFMPHTKKSAAKEENGDPICFVEIGLPFPFPNLWADTKSLTRQEPSGAYERAWTLVRGNYRRNTGSWTLYPYGEGGKKTLLVYFIDTDPKVAIPDWILRAAQTGSVNELFKSIRKRVVTLRAK